MIIDDTLDNDTPNIDNNMNNNYDYDSDNNDNDDIDDANHDNDKSYEMLTIMVLLVMMIRVIIQQPYSRKCILQNLVNLVKNPSFWNLLIYLVYSY